MILLSNLHDFLDNEEQVNHEGFKVDDDQKANWALRKIKQLQDTQKENDELVEKEVEKYKNWLSAENGQIQQSIDFFQSHLAGYALSKREVDEKFKSLKLPNGKISFRKQQPEYKYDDDLLVKSLKDTGQTDLIKIKESPDKASLKKKFVVHEGKLVNPETGEYVEGVTVEPQEDAFKVEVSE